jgi:hypothetical protein
MVESLSGIYNGGGHPWCGRRMYIDFADKEMFSMALSASVAKQAVNLYILMK